ncbi:hypothetical protein C8R45DRAFT_929643 [Mycena sanguinolenta]|nr:hypothetical protein C8R45DRAFT_929643 [Mycena sanguinolenta]
MVNTLNLFLAALLVATSVNALPVVERDVWNCVVKFTRNSTISGTVHLQNDDIPEHILTPTEKNEFTQAHHTLHSSTAILSREYPAATLANFNTCMDFDVVASPISVLTRPTISCGSRVQDFLAVRRGSGSQKIFTPSVRPEVSARALAGACGEGWIRGSWSQSRSLLVVCRGARNRTRVGIICMQIICGIHQSVNHSKPAIADGESLFRVMKMWLQVDN